jgi:outer membrane biosynthesis protein TonB
MRLHSGKRLGQSSYELALAVFLSFFLHAGIVAASLLLYFASPKTKLPPVYSVKLVGQLAEVAPVAAPATASTPQTPKTETRRIKEKPRPKAAKAAPKQAKAPPKKSAIPELSQQKPKPVQQEPAKPASEPARPGQAASPSGGPSPAAEPALSGAKGNVVAVTTPQEDFKFTWYLINVSTKIKLNWKPLRGERDALARVLFKINRSGWVVDVRLDQDNTHGPFDFKQAAIRAIKSSSPFPPLPDEFPKQFLEFSVDLIPEEQN